MRMHSLFIIPAGLLWLTLVPSLSMAEEQRTSQGYSGSVSVRSIVDPFHVAAQAAKHSDLLNSGLVDDEKTGTPIPIQSTQRASPPQRSANPGM